MALWASCAGLLPPDRVSRCCRLHLILPGQSDAGVRGEHPIARARAEWRINRATALLKR